MGFLWWGGRVGGNKGMRWGKEKRKRMEWRGNGEAGWVIWRGGR